MSKLVRLSLALAAVGHLPSVASAAILSVTVTVENLAPTNSVAIAPLRLGFNNGAFDAFNIGGTATDPIISVAEGGSGRDWFPAFAGADPTAVLGSVGARPILPGATASNTFVVDTTVNPFFTFATMVVPSNDFFFGNDSPTAFRLFDAAGNLLIHSIDQQASDIWDAGSEAFDPLHAAFLEVGTNSLRTAQGGVVNFNFDELSGFNGLTTAAGYTFDGQLDAGTDILRITFSTATAVPEPTSLAAFLGIAGIAAAGRLRGRTGRRPVA